MAYKTTCTEAYALGRNCRRFLECLVGLRGGWALLRSSRCVVAHALVLTCSGAFFTQSALGAGFAVTAQGAAASGKGGAFTAQADDPSAIYYNPAGISQLRTSEVLVGTTVIVPDTEYSPLQTGQGAEEEPQAFFLPQLYVTAPIGHDLTAGLGLYTPFGVATDWPTDWDGRFQITYVGVQATMLTPTVSWQINPKAAVAGGVNVAYVKLTERRQINLSRVGEDAGFGPVPGNPEGAVEVEGDAVGFGYNLGTTIAPNDRWQIGLTYRSEVRADLNDLEADFTIPSGPFTPFFPDGEAETTITLPPSVRAGVLFRPIPQWNIEGEAIWTGWSTIDQLVIRFDEGLPPPGTDTTLLLWDDAMAYGVGTQYEWSNFAVRGGYTLDYSPIPDNTVSPILPDGTRHWFSAGAGYKASRWSADLGYHLILFQRVKDNQYGSNFSSAGSPPAIPAIDARANGTYRTVVHSVVLSVRFSF
ncbi:MAG: outer membrane protein transport protein [Nitrospirota bacterium]